MARLTRPRSAARPEADAEAVEPGDVENDVEPGDVEPSDAEAEAVDVEDEASDREAEAADPEDVETEDEASNREAEAADPEAGDAGGDAGSGDDEPAPARPGPPPRNRRLVVAGAVAVVSLALATVLALASRSDDGGGGGDGTTPATPSTSMETGGLDVPVPEGWSAAPIPQLGFGFAYPPGWEVVVLQPEMLNSLTRSEPRVTGFVEAAHAAAEQGFVLYAAGEDGEGGVTDLKVGAIPETDVADSAGLEAYARQLAEQPGLTDPEVERVEGTEHPTVRLRFRSTSESEDGERITTTGIETLVLGPGDILWSIIVTGEDADLVGDLAPDLVDTFVFAEP